MGEKSEADLRTAFAGESQANRRYLFFAAKADADGLPLVARLFRAAAEAETVHARNHFNAMTGIGSTIDNLSAAVIGEHQEFTRMYPIMIDHAIEEESEVAQRTFEWANQVEKLHYDLFQKTLKTVREKGTLPSEAYFVCQQCGNTVLGKPPEKCPVCGAPYSRFKEIA
jgi:rubrerythrin